MVCANKDHSNPTVMDLLRITESSELQVAGRLDKDTTGMVLLTNDGQWNHRVSAPRRGCFKHYLVHLEKPLSNAVAEQFAHGVYLVGESKSTRPAKLTIIDSHKAELAIQEGRYHQVKRMFAAVGNRVVQLHRFQIGKLKLDPKLAPGEFRALTVDEIGNFD